MNPLESIYYISIPEGFTVSDAAFKIDPTIKLQFQKKVAEAPGDFHP